MYYGWIKTAVDAPQVRVADCIFNAEAVIASMRRAAVRSVRLLVLPELCLTAATCGDLFLQGTLLRAAQEALAKVREASRGLSMVTFVGLPLEFGGKLYNCAAAVFEGRVLGIVPKSAVPQAQRRWFSPAPAEGGEVVIGREKIPFGTDLIFSCDPLPQFSIAAEIGEDLAALSSPIERIAAGAQIIVNLSAAAELIGRSEQRRQMAAAQSARLHCAYLCANAGYGESTTDYVFGGHRLICENGRVLAETSPFADGLTVTDIDVLHLADDRRAQDIFPAMPPHRRIGFSMMPEMTVVERNIPRMPFIPEDAAERAARCAQILNMQAQGLRRRLEHAWAKCAVVALSGGLDSTLALLVAARAMDLLGRPRTDILAVTMPCFGTTVRTRGNAEKLAECLGVRFETVDILASARQHLQDISLPEDDRSTTYENAQARERTQVAMDIAGREGGLVVGTGDLSELALGWATYNGDHMSMYGVNGAVPKTLVRHIVCYCAEESSDPALREVLLDILDTPVSPELLPPKEGEIAQITEDIVGPYELHDFFLYHLLRWRESPAKILHQAQIAFGEDYDRATILKWLTVFCRRFFMQQFKRSCLPDGVKIGSVSLSPRGDWCMPSDASAAVWMKELEALAAQEVSHG